jgi:hypothetical protein
MAEGALGPSRFDAALDRPERDGAKARPQRRRSRPIRGLLLGVLLAPTIAAAAWSAPDPIAGFYLGADPPAATLEVRRDGDGYLVRLEGGSPPDPPAGAPADCAIAARGRLEGGTLRARFGPIEGETFSYGPAEADRERRTLEITFAAEAAEVIAADTFGYCGLGVEFRGRYRRER